MTIAQMHQEVKVGIDKGDSLNSANFAPEVIDVFLNNNIEKFISQRAYGDNTRKEGLEETQKRVDDLKNLITNTNITTFTNTVNNKINGVFVTLPTDYLHSIEEECNIDYLDCNNITKSVKVPVIAITHDRYNKIVRDPFNKATKKKVLRLSYGLSGTNEQFELITEGTITLQQYILRYIRKPASVRYGTTYATPTTDIDCDLSSYTHKEIIKMTVDEMLGNTGDPKVNIVDKELKTIE